jgi:hypothetical protein
MNNTDYKLAVDKLRAVLAARDSDPVLRDLIKAKDACLARYTPIFSLHEISSLTAEQFKSFLLFENNKHWTGLGRKGYQACSDMVALREALSLLFDEKKTRADRMNKVADEIPGIGKALITALMLVAYRRTDPAIHGMGTDTSIRKR